MCLLCFLKSLFSAMENGLFLPLFVVVFSSCVSYYRVVPLTGNSPDNNTKKRKKRKRRWLNGDEEERTR